MSATIIRNGRVIDPANKRDEVGDVYIENGKIVASKSEIRNPKNASPARTEIRSSKLSEAILLQPAIKCASTQTERFGGFAGVSVVPRQRFFDQESFDFFEAHVFETARIVPAGR